MNILRQQERLGNVLLNVANSITNSIDGDSRFDEGQKFRSLARLI